MLVVESEYPRFLSNVRASRGKLHPLLGVPGPMVLRALACYQPDEWCKAVAACGEILRKNPNTPLINTEITNEIPDGRPQLGRTALKTILNTSLSPDTSNKPGRTFTSSSVDMIDTCDDAEERFEFMFAKMHDPFSPNRYKDAHIKPYWAIVTDESEEPIAVKKFVGESSALSLVPLTVNGVTYPAGALYRMDSSKPLHEEAGARYKIASKDIGHIAFMRLSAFAFPLSERFPLFNNITLRDFKTAETPDLQALAERSLPAAEPAIFDQALNVA